MVGVLKAKPIERIAVFACERVSHTEYYLNGSALPGSSDEESAFQLFAQAGELLSRNRIQPVQEKLFGLRSFREDILSIRHESYLKTGADPQLPYTFVEGAPVDKRRFAGLQIWGIAPRKAGGNVVSTIELPDGTFGRCWNGEGFRMLYFPFIRAIEEEEDCVTCHAREMFSNASAALASQGLAFGNVIRTWIYVARLLDWYGEFNRIRNEHFNEEGLARENGSVVFPASTGIQGKCFDEECFMDFIALDTFEPGRVKVRPIVTTSRQNQPFTYGSAFSRGMAVEIEGKRTVFVSGTASINAMGETVNPGDAETQAVETLLNIAALLDDQGGSLANICSATVYCKSQKAYEIYKRVLHLLGAPSFPSICVIADICRPDLEIEIEAVAVL